MADLLRKIESAGTIRPRFEMREGVVPERKEGGTDVSIE